MSNVDSISYNLHRLSIHNAGPEDVLSPQDQISLNQYIQMVLNDVVNSTNSCQFKFDEPQELVAINLDLLIKSSKTFDLVSEDIAIKLHKEELEAQNKLVNLKNEIKKGVLIQVYFTNNGIYQYLIIKVDDNEFLDINTLTLSDGLPSEKTRTQKAVLITFDNNEISELLISDSNSKISTYWYKDFLKATTLNSAEKNTKDSFSEIEKALRKVNKASSYDYILIRNDIVSYYRNNVGFVYEDVVNKIKSHVFENKNLIKNKVKSYDGSKVYTLNDVFPSVITTLNNLPAEKKFDTQFDIQPGVIKAKLINKVTLDKYFDLYLKGDIDDLSSRVIACDDDDGKFIKIYSEDGYNKFYKGKDVNVDELKGEQ